METYNNMSIFVALQQWLKPTACEPYHRQCLVIKTKHIANNKQQAISAYINLFEQRFNTVCIVSDIFNHRHIDMLPSTVLINVKKTMSALGQSFDCVVFDASAGLNMNACYAASGLVDKCGLLVLILPPHINDYYLQQASSGIAFSYNDTHPVPRFAQIFERLLQQPHISMIDNQRVDLAPKQSISKTDVHSPAAFTSQQIVLSSTQQHIANQIVKLTNKQTIHVVLGDRGRGKSTLLGQIAYRLLSNERSVTITANIQSHTAVISRTVKDADSASLSSQKLAKFERFIAPDALLNQQQYTDVLIVDEMASIAPSLLLTIISQYKLVIMAGTVGGYEGSGKGFLQRVMPQLLAHKNCVLHELNQPFRWFNNDPIEALFTQLFSGIPPKPTTNNHQTYDSIQYKWIDKADIISDLHLYQQIFTLLSLAHYQNTPNDVLRTLDSNDHHILVACTDNQEILGVVVAIFEGNIASENNNPRSTLNEIAPLIARGKRRVQGHVTPQSIAFYINEPQACNHGYLRISRIAVAEQARRQGIGCSLIKQCENYGKHHQVDALSVSFGVNHRLLAFWEQLKFILIKLGTRVDTASGSISALLIKPLTSNTHLTIYAQHCEYKLLLDNTWWHHLYKANPTYNQGAYHVIQQDYLQAYLQKQPCWQASKLDDFVLNSCRLFIHHDINLSQAASAVFYLCSKHALHTSITDLCAYFAAGKHKHEKLNIEERLRTTLRTIIN